MPKTVVAQEGDTLCGLAIAHGFLNCDPLRAEGDNADYLSRPLAPGDRVTIPDPRVEPLSVPTDRIKRVRLKRRPPPLLRFVRGEDGSAAKDDPSLRRLHISNYKTDMAGDDAQQAFTNAFGWDEDAHADPDTFKVELLTPDGGSPKITLEALKPVYAADGSVSRHEPFDAAIRAGRQLEAETQVTDSDPKRFRTRYLRLVVDDQDKNALPDQTLLVSDIADGNNGAADRVEILDQRIEARYELPACPAGAHKCTVRKSLEVGEDRKRIRMRIHIFNRTFGGAAIGGATEQMVRLRTYRWFRRLYAQTSMAPKLESVTFREPPPADTLAISQAHGRVASGLNGAGGASTLSFTLDFVAGAAPVGFTPQNVSINLATGTLPRNVGAAIVAALPAGFSGTVLINTRATNAANPSCDVHIRHTSGGRLRIRNETTTDTAMTVAVARVNIANLSVTTGPFAELLVYTPEARRCMRTAGGDAQLDFFVVGNIPGARGVAMVPGSEMAAGYRPPSLLRYCAFLRATVMTAADTDPFSFPHEAGHILNDAFHVDNSDPIRTNMMMRSGTNGANSMAASKRISDDPVQNQWQRYDPAQATPGAFHVAALRPTQRFRQKSGSVTESW